MFTTFLTRSLGQQAATQTRGGNRGVSNQSGAQNRAIILGAGNVVPQIVGAALERNFLPTVCSANPTPLKQALDKAGLGDRVQFKKISYSEGKDPKFLTGLFHTLTSGADTALVVNTRGGIPPQSQTPEEELQAHQEMNRAPVLAAADALIEGNRAKNAALVDLTTSAASVKGFSKVNKYTEFREETGKLLAERCNQAGLRGMNLRCDLITSPFPMNRKVNHSGASFSEQALGLFQWAVGPENVFKEVLTSQDVDGGQVAKAIFNPSIPQQSSFTTVNAVGPEARTQEQQFQFYTDLYQTDQRIVILPPKVVEWAAKHFGGQLDLGYRLIEHRANNPSANVPLDHKAFEELVGEPLMTLEQSHQSIGNKAVGIQSPTRMLARKTLEKLFSDPVALKDFKENVLPHIPNITAQALSTLFT